MGAKLFVYGTLIGLSGVEIQIETIAYLFLITATALQYEHYLQIGVSRDL